MLKFLQTRVRTTHIGDCTCLYNYAGVRTPIIQWTVHFLLKCINSNTCTEYSELEGALSPTLKWMALNTGIKPTSLALLESCSNQLILHHWQNLILKVHLQLVWHLTYDSTTWWMLQQGHVAFCHHSASAFMWNRMKSTGYAFQYWTVGQCKTGWITLDASSST